MMTDIQLISGGVCELCGGRANAKVPIYKKVRYGRSNGRITTGKWAYSCLDCLPRVEKMTTLGVNR